MPGASVEALADHIFREVVRQSQLHVEDNGVIHDVHAGVTTYSNSIFHHLLQSEFERAKKVLMDLFAQSNPQPGSVPQWSLDVQRQGLRLVLVYKLLGGQEGCGKMTVELIPFIRGGFAF